jgi:streptogramin lyase
MPTKIEKIFRSPYSVPNGLQVTDEGLWIVDQITDRVVLVEIVCDPEYHVPKHIRDIPSDSSNTSGMAFGGGSLWLAANGPGDRWRAIRDTDAETGEIFQVNPATGETLGRFPVPEGGGTHGVEYDNYDEGHLWVQTLKNQEIHKVRISDWSIQHTLPLPYGRAHGTVRVEDGLWVTHTSDRVIVKLDLEDGTILDKIEVSEDNPEPHGLSIYGNDFLYCDAASGWVAKITW